MNLATKRFAHPLCTEVVDAFLVYCKCVLARLLGIRMCPQCPHCNANEAGNPCQDEFGSNMLPFGGIFGACEALAGAVEYQKNGTPHFHGLASCVNVFQHNTLLEVARRVEEDLLQVDRGPSTYFIRTARCSFYPCLCRNKRPRNQ